MGMPEAMTETFLMEMVRDGWLLPMPYRDIKDAQCARFTEAGRKRTARLSAALEKAGERRRVCKPTIKRKTVAKKGKR